MIVGEPMIDIKPPEEERNGLIYDDLVPETPPKIVKIVDSRAIRIENELHELNKTLKDILREMRKRKV
jgi:hypothetical protein